MHGLINKAIQSFVGDAFGLPVWQAVLHVTGLWETVGAEGFDPLLIYDPGVTRAVLDATAAEVGRPVDELLEDLGNYLVSHPRNEVLRRLLRFGGENFTDFLRSLDDLRGRTRLAVPDLDLPDLTLQDLGGGRFRLVAPDCPPGYGLVLAGALRALADDYGALVVLDHRREGEAGESLQIDVHDPAFHAGRRFELAAPGERP